MVSREGPHLGLTDGVLEGHRWCRYRVLQQKPGGLAKDDVGLSFIDLHESSERGVG